jgi:hypothetical protein
VFSNVQDAEICGIMQSGGFDGVVGLHGDTSAAIENQDDAYDHVGNEDEGGQENLGRQDPDEEEQEPQAVRG